jgi:hypothetical protein
VTSKKNFKTTCRILETVLSNWVLTWA